MLSYRLFVKLLVLYVGSRKLSTYSCHSLNDGFIIHDDKFVWESSLDIYWTSVISCLQYRVLDLTTRKYMVIDKYFYSLFYFKVIFFPLSNMLMLIIFNGFCYADWNDGNFYDGHRRPRTWWLSVWWILHWRVDWTRPSSSQTSVESPPSTLWHRPPTLY